MRVFLNLPPSLKVKSWCIATIGVFDGLHLAHIELIKRVIKEAKRRNQKSLLVTFWPHPLMVLKKRFEGYLTTLEEKLQILKGLQLDYVWVIRFDSRFSLRSSQSFLSYLNRYFLIKKLIVGENFRFGRDARATTSLLKRLAKRLNMEVEVLRKLRIKNRVVSSSFIRRLIRGGELNKARLFLGRYYSFRSRVIKGRGIAQSLLGIRTANFKPSFKVLPPSGVYLAKVKYEEKFYKGVAYLGTAPTLEGGDIFLETHILNFNQSLLRKVIEVYLIKKIRAERKFKNLDELKFQVLLDINRAKSYFSHHNIL